MGCMIDAVSTISSVVLMMQRLQYIDEDNYRQLFYAAAASPTNCSRHYYYTAALYEGASVLYEGASHALSNTRGTAILNS